MEHWGEDNFDVYMALIMNPMKISERDDYPTLILKSLAASTPPEKKTITRRGATFFMGDTKFDIKGTGVINTVIAFNEKVGLLAWFGCQLNVTSGDCFTIQEAVTGFFEVRQ